MNVRHDMVTIFVARPVGASHEFLQLRRVPSNYMGGTWQTVSGKVKPGETAAQGALRELREETGLMAMEFYRLSQLASFYTVPNDTIWHNPVFFALVDPDGEIVMNHEHDAHRWVAVEQANASFMWPIDRQLIAEIRQEIFSDSALKPHLRIQMD